MNNSLEVIAEAFSLKAQNYDAFAQDHPHLTRLRNKVYAHLERFIPKGARILELNAGTGIDAVELARRGYFVHATDIATGMLERAQEKVQRQGLEERITLQNCSFTNLAAIRGSPYDAVFSNFGGLNCLKDLKSVIDQLPLVVKPGGLITWVLMPRFCLWETAEILRGHPGVAFRRFAKNGTRTHLEGYYFTTYYFTPQQVVSWFDLTYECLAIEGLSVITPTAGSKDFPKRYPRIYHALARLDDWLSQKSPWRGWGDFFILTMRAGL